MGLLPQEEIFYRILKTAYSLKRFWAYPHGVLKGALKVSGADVQFVQDGIEAQVRPPVIDAMDRLVDPGVVSTEFRQEAEEILLDNSNPQRKRFGLNYLLHQAGALLTPDITDIEKIILGFIGRIGAEMTKSAATKPDGKKTGLPIRCNLPCAPAKLHAVAWRQHRPASGTGLIGVFNGERSPVVEKYFHAGAGKNFRHIQLVLSYPVPSPVAIDIRGQRAAGRPVK